MVLNLNLWRYPKYCQSHEASSPTFFDGIPNLSLEKKNLLFQFLLELGMFDTNLSDLFLTEKWYIPLDEEICWGL